MNLDPGEGGPLFAYATTWIVTETIFGAVLSLVVLCLLAAAQHFARAHRIVEDIRRSV